MKNKILVIDDEFLIRYTLAEGLKDRGYEAESAGSVEEGLEKMKTFGPEVILLDNLLENSRGMDEIPAFRKLDENVQVIMMTAYGSVSQAVEAIKQGAYDYVLKPFDIDEIEIIISRSLESVRNRESLEFLKGQTKEFLGSSESAIRIRSDIALLGENSSVSVMIRGETGTGKEVVARLIHESSDRRDHLMVRINCGAIPENLMESELFGYEKGAFTGAVKSKKGLFELADGGTVFLDEIGELPLSMQAKLLTFLDDKKFKRVGGLNDIAVDVRVLAATNRDLEKEVAEKRFREDLFYRLNVIQIEIPPLRQRREDIKDLCAYYLDYYNKKFSRSIHGVEPSFMEELMAYEWKGNVRELKNIFERCFLFSRGGLLEKHVELGAGNGGARTDGAERAGDAPGAAGSFAIKDLKEGPIDLEREVAELENLYMDAAMELCGGNMSKASALLGISRFAMKRKMEGAKTHDVRNHT